MLQFVILLTVILIIIISKMKTEGFDQEKDREIQEEQESYHHNLERMENTDKEINDLKVMVSSLENDIDKLKNDDSGVGSVAANPIDLGPSDLGFDYNSYKPNM